MLSKLRYGASEDALAFEQANLASNDYWEVRNRRLDAYREKRTVEEIRREEAEAAVDPEVKEHLFSRCGRLSRGLCGRSECNWAARPAWMLAEYGAPICEPRQTFEALVKAARERLDREAAGA